MKHRQLEFLFKKLPTSVRNIKCRQCLFFWGAAFSSAPSVSLRAIQVEREKERERGREREKLNDNAEVSIIHSRSG